VATMVDQYDSTMGYCDQVHAYQRPYDNNIVDASRAVWVALGVPSDDWGRLDITRSDALKFHIDARIMKACLVLLWLLS
jgi:hypothetical protein